MLVKTAERKYKSIDEKAKTVEVLVSDDSIDHDGEIIALTAWDARLPEFRRNPIFCWGHPLGDRQAKPERLLGVSKETNRDAEGLVCLFQYAVDINPMARMCWEMTVADILRAYSVGGQPFKEVCWWDEAAVINALLPKYREALTAGQAGCVITDIELWEVSQVLKGANRNALREAMAKGLIKQADLAPLYGRAYPILAPVAIDLKTIGEQAVNKQAEEKQPEEDTAPVDKTEPAAASNYADNTKSEDDEEAQLEAALKADPSIARDLVDLLSYLV